MGAGTKKLSIFEEEEEEDAGTLELRVNEDYARRFEHNKKREELHRLEEKQKMGLLPRAIDRGGKRGTGAGTLTLNPRAGDSFGANGARMGGVGGKGEGEYEDYDDDDEDDEDEDEEEEDGLAVLNEDARFLDVLNRIKRRDPAIYQPGVHFFREENEGEGEGEDGGEGTKAAEGAAKGKRIKGAEAGQARKKAVFLKDVVAQQLLDGGSGDEEAEEEEEGGGSEGRRRKGGQGADGGGKGAAVGGYMEELRSAKEELLRAADAAGGEGGEEESSEEEGGRLLRVRTRAGSRGGAGGQQEGNEGEEDNGEGSREGEEEGRRRAVMAKLEAAFGADERLDEGERFLKQYLRDQMWKAPAEEAPRYADVVGEVEEDEEDVEVQEQFEHSFNFRFEEPGSTTVTSHARQLEGSIRRKSEARRLARKAKAERLAAQELARQEEVKRLKNLKRQELEAKLEQLKAVAGTRHEEGVRRVLELAEDEEEFDPEEYDAQMRAAFGDEYEAEEDEEMALRKGGDEEEEEEEGRPDFAKEDELLGLPKGWLDVGTKGFAEVRAKQLQGVPGEGESEEEDEGEEEEEEDAEAKTIKKKKGKIPLRDKLAFDQRLEEYYKMDYEDMIGDLPTRFKYREVAPNRFGLSSEEILSWDEKELRQVVSLKRIAPYRTQEWQIPDWQRRQLAAQKRRMKEAAETGDGGKQRRRKQKRNGTHGGPGATQGRREFGKPGSTNHPEKDRNGAGPNKGAGPSGEGREKKEEKMKKSSGGGKHEQHGSGAQGGGATKGGQHQGQGQDQGLPAQGNGSGVEPKPEKVGKAARKNFLRKQKRKEKEKQRNGAPQAEGAAQGEQKRSLPAERLKSYEIGRPRDELQEKKKKKMRRTPVSET